MKLFVHQATSDKKAGGYTNVGELEGSIHFKIGICSSNIIAIKMYINDLYDYVKTTNVLG